MKPKAHNLGNFDFIGSWLTILCVAQKREYQLSVNNSSLVMTPKIRKTSMGLSESQADWLLDGQKALDA